MLPSPENRAEAEPGEAVSPWKNTHPSPGNPYLMTLPTSCSLARAPQLLAQRRLSFAAPVSVPEPSVLAPNVFVAIPPSLASVTSLWQTPARDSTPKGLRGRDPIKLSGRPQQPTQTCEIHGSIQHT